MLKFASCLAVIHYKLQIMAVMDYVAVMVMEDLSFQMLKIQSFRDLDRLQITPILIFVSLNQFQVVVDREAEADLVQVLVQVQEADLVQEAEVEVEVEVDQVQVQEAEQVPLIQLVYF